VKLFGRPQIIYQAQAISLESGEAFRKHQLSVLGEIQHANKRALRTIYTCMVLMGCWSAVMLGGFIYLLPMLKERVEVIRIAVDRVNGYIQQIDGVDGDPMLYSEAIEKNAIREYLEYWYDYTWETNRKHEDRIRMMSSADQLARYKAWADTEPNSPKQRLAHHGSSEIDHIVYHKQAQADAKTFEYLVQFAYRETANGRTEPGWHQYTGHIQFQWQPKLVTDADWASKNPGGFYVTYFKADEDPK
jgi:type IV secretory pathway component VirB8